MNYQVLSTAKISERDRFPYWCAAVNEIGVLGERDRSPETPFDGLLVATTRGPLVRFRFRSSKYRVCRRPRASARHCGDERIWLYRELGEGCLHDDHDRQFVTRSGDVIIGDPVLPSATEAIDRYDHEIWHFPRALLDPHLPATQHPLLVHLSGRDGLNGIFFPYLEALSEQVDALGDGEAAMVADNFCRLIAIACGAQIAGHGQAIRAARLEEVKRYIGMHLPDPELTPRTAAAATKICVRQLHSLFEPTGISFGEYVLHRRLEECRATLISPAGVSRSVTDIAFAWGFNSLPTFYRAFRREFGMCPREMRDAYSST
jgi:AraC-like DNA-binding protein